MSPSSVRLEGLSNSSSPSFPVWCARCAPGSEREVRVEQNAHRAHTQEDSGQTRWTVLLDGL